MADVKWIKICTDIFDDEKMQLIDGLPEHDAILVIWFKLLCMAGKQNNGGVFMLNDKIAYTDEMLATIFRRPINIVRLALNTFEQFGMIEIVNNAYTIPNWEKHQNLDKLETLKEQNRLRVAKHREKQRLLSGTDGCNVTVTLCNDTDIDKDIDKDIDINNNISPSATTKATKHKYGEYKNVLLTDDEYAKLQEKFPNDYMQKIENLSEGIALKGYKYKSHYLAILKWARNDNGKAVTGGDINGRTDGKDKLEGWKPTNGLWI